MPMKLIVGLGNPGKQYENTRHNVGFMVLDQLQQTLAPQETWKKDKSNALTLAVKHDKTSLLLVKPQTYMNNSGIAVKNLLSFYKIPLQNLYVIYDDLDLPLGEIRIKKEGSSGGHNGLQSIIDMAKSETFHRVRIGIGRPIAKEDNALQKQQITNYVLERFSIEEREKVQEVIQKTTQSLLLLIKHGYEQYMSTYNK